MNILTERVNILDLIERTDDIRQWLFENPLADIRLFEDKANQLACLSVKIAVYNKNNSPIK